MERAREEDRENERGGKWRRVRTGINGERGTQEVGKWKEGSKWKKAVRGVLNGERGA